MCEERLVIRNLTDIKPPENAGLLDNCILLLPKIAVMELHLTPNIEDKGMAKELWLGRVWQMRSMLTKYYQEIRKWQEGGSVVSRATQSLIDDIAKDRRKLSLLIHVQKCWRAMLKRRISSFEFIFDKIEDVVRTVVVFMHGSGGMTYNNLRFCRMLAGMGCLVIAPDDMASSKHRHRDVQPLKDFDTPTDYWADDLMYASGSSGEYSYNTQADLVTKDPDKYKELYSKVYEERRSELHTILSAFPPSADSLGVFIMGTSEGAMTVARFDDQRYGPMINGRIISAFSVEYCYFTPTPEDGQFGGNLEVPTLNLIGDADQYFGVQDSIAQNVSKDGASGYGNQHLTGNAFQTMLKQGMTNGCVCVFEGGKHDLTETHDNALRQILRTFITTPGHCHCLPYIWRRDPGLREQMEGLIRPEHSKLALVRVKKSMFSQKENFEHEKTLHQIHRPHSRWSVLAHGHPEGPAIRSAAAADQLRS